MGVELIRLLLLEISETHITRLNWQRVRASDKVIDTVDTELQRTLTLYNDYDRKASLLRDQIMHGDVVNDSKTHAQLSQWQRKAFLLSDMAWSSIREKYHLWGNHFLIIREHYVLVEVTKGNYLEGDISDDDYENDND